MTDSNADLQANVRRLRRLNAELAAWREINERLLDATTLEDAASEAVSILVSLFGAAGGVLLLTPGASSDASDSWQYDSASETAETVPEEVRPGLRDLIVRDQQPLIEPNAAAFLARAGLPTAPALRSLLALPLTAGDEQLGALVLYNFHLPRHMQRYAEEAAAILSPIAHAISRLRARERLLEAERMRAHLAETVAAEVNHRMKNNLAIAAGLLQMQAGNRTDRAAAALIQAVTRLRSLATVHEQMSETQAQQVELVDALSRIGDIAREALSRGEVEVAVSGSPLFYPSKVGTTLCVAANELVTNAIKYGAPGPDGKLRIKLSATLEGDKLRLQVWNSGNPIPASFDPSRRKTMGLRLVYDLTVTQCGGSFTMRPHDGGTLAEIVVDDQALRGEA